MLKSSRFKTITLSVLFGFVILLALVLSMAGQITRWYIPKYLQNVGVTADIAEVNLLLLDSKLELKGLSTTADTDHRLSVELLSVDWQWQGLMSRHFLVDSVIVEGLVVDMTSSKGKVISIGSLDLTQFERQPSSGETPAVNDQTSNDQVTLKLLQFDDIEVCQIEQQANAGQKSCIKWQSLAVEGEIFVSSQQPLKTAVDINLAQLQVDALIAQSNAGQNKAQLTLDSLALQQVKFDLANQLGRVADIDLAKLAARNHEYQLTTEAVKLSTLDLHMQGEMKLAAVGVVNIDVQQSAKPLASVGSVSLQDLTFDWVKQLGSLVSTNVSGLNADVADFQLSTNSINLGRVDFDLANQITVATTQLKHFAVAQSSHPLAAFEQFTFEQLNVGLQPELQQAQVQGIELTQTGVWQLSSRNEYDQLLKLTQLNIDSVVASRQAQQIKGIKLEGIGLMTDLSASDESMLIKLNAIDVSELSHAEQIAVGKVAVTGLDANMVFDKEDGLNVSHWLAKPQSETSEPNPKTESKTAKAVSIESVTVGNNSQLVLHENTQGKMLTHEVKDIDLMLSGIALFAEPKAMDVRLSASLTAPGKLQVDGQLVPDAENLMVSLKTQLKSLPLTPYSIYSEKNIGYRIDQGQGNVDVNVKIADNNIDSDVALNLNKFQLGDLQQNEKSELNQELGLPLPLALNLLRDGDDNIELATEINGSLDDPNFSLADVVETVSLKALKSALLYAYSPLGFVTVTSGIIDLATALRFEPVLFDAQVIELNDKQRQRLQKVATVMTDKPKVSLVLCATATQADLTAEQVFDPNNIEPLLTLANQRQLAVQQYLHQQYSIATERLLLCNVKLDQDAKAQPKVGISL